MKRKPALSDIPCCLILPYHVTIYHDGYVPKGELHKPYMTDSGRVYVELTTKHIAILEQGKQHSQYEKTRALVKEIAQKGLDHNMAQSIEQHEGIGGFNSWILPLTTRRYPSFIMLTERASVLRGTHLEWKKRKAGIYFTANVHFCVTADR
jgi:hypothetical protein